jgi:hypothetical protein
MVDFFISFVMVELFVAVQALVIGLVWVLVKDWLEDRR